MEYKQVLNSSNEIYKVEGEGSIGTNGHDPRVVAIYGGSDGMDIFYLRIRDELHESDEAALARAQDWAEVMSNVILNKDSGTWRKW